MESFDNFFDEEWHSFELMSSPCDLGLNFKIPNIFFSDSDNSSNVYSFVAEDEHLVNVSDNNNPNFYHFFSQENSISCSDASNDTISNMYTNDNTFPFCPSSIVPQLSNDVCDQSARFHMMNEINNSSPTTQLFSEGSLYLTQDLVLPEAGDDDVIHEETDKNPKKRTRVSRDNKNKKNLQPKKNQKKNDGEERNKKNNGEMNGQSSSSCSSNDDLNLSQDLNGASNFGGKTRASRGTATDPQSLYARKRRERINERLRILQNLVPNGTKVDISTMLEEAVEYVKFLKLQIQLLSSDDMWMYAPIAYNGMDMGLYQNISQNLPN